MTYAEKLRDPRWQKKRLQVFERDDFTCQGCADKERTLTVHHCYYQPKTQPWEYRDDSLVTLCDSCHNEITFRLTQILSLIKTPNDAVMSYELLRLLGGTNTQAFTMALKMGFAMETLNDAVNRHDTTPAIAVINVLIGELRKIVDSITTK